jgi:voltage-gated potassium channel
LEAAKEDDSLSRTVDCLLIVLISLNVAAVALESVAELSATYGAYFFVFEMISVGIFTVEYLLRVWSCVENEILTSMSPLKVRLKYMRTPMAALDLIVPFYLAFIVNIDLRFLRVLRLLRIFRLTRYGGRLSP